MEAERWRQHACASHWRNALRAHWCIFRCSEIWWQALKSSSSLKMKSFLQRSQSLSEISSRVETAKKKKNWKSFYTSIDQLLFCFRNFFLFFLLLVVFCLGLGIKPVTFTLWWDSAAHWGAPYFPGNETLTPHHSKTLPWFVFSRMWHYLSKHQRFYSLFFK